jgi:hypothetical protein
MGVDAAEREAEAGAGAELDGDRSLVRNRVGGTRADRSDAAEDRKPGPQSQASRGGEP